MLRSLFPHLSFYQLPYKVSPVYPNIKKRSSPEEKLEYPLNYMPEQCRQLQPLSYHPVDHQHEGLMGQHIRQIHHQRLRPPILLCCFRMDDPPYILMGTFVTARCLNCET